jgi:hypothetical protein
MAQETWGFTGGLVGAGSSGGKGRPKDSHLLAGDLGRDTACFPLVRMGRREAGAALAGQARSQEGPFEPET